ncbi:MAG: sialidase family protein [Gammaproteobacteria bacterium]|nr:sialidase family protein [Gammaproteobacteria bacterium]
MTQLFFPACPGRLLLILFFLISITDANAQFVITDINPDQSTLDASDPDGATGGRINGLATTHGNANVYYAASEFGGLYKTTDFQVNGGQWFRLEAHLPMLTIDVEVSPDGFALYASSLYDGRVNSVAGINVSYDGGASWTKPLTATPAPGSCAEATAISEPSATGISVDPNNPAAVNAGTNCGLAISNDFGASWTYSNPFAPAASGTIWDVVVHHGGIIDVCGQSCMVMSL